ncbi:MAG: hypothetical protein WCD16_05190 [Paracoccaceae bacterium]
MVIGFLLIGVITGLASAIISLLAYDAGLFAALVMYCVGGAVGVVVAALIALSHRPVQLRLRRMTHDALTQSD